MHSNPLQLQVKGTATVTAPVTLAPETLSVAEDGGTGTYTVVLDTQPTDEVTVTLTAGTGVTVDTDSVSTGNQNTLMFTTSNWNTAQTVTVTGVNDAVDNPGGRSVSIGHAASSTDSNYVIADAGSVTVTVTDDEATAVTLAGAAGDVTEGSSKTFTVTLGRGLVSGESLAVPLSFGGTATRGTDYTVTGAAATGVTYQNLDSGSATVTFTGPDSGATATTATLTLSATTDSVTESSGETVDISLGTLSANSGTGLGGGASGTDNLAEFSITDADTAPTVATAIGDQSATEGASFTFVVPAGTFTDADGDTLSYTATQADAAALPDWLSFDAATRTFSGTPAAADVGTLSVKVTTSDGKGGTASDTFDIVVTGLTAVTIDTDLGGVLKAAGPVTVTITFSAAVTGFAETDLAVVRGTVSDFTEVTSGTVWTVVLTPNPDFNGRSVILTIPAGAAADANSNGNKKAQMSIIYEARLQAPAAFTVTPGNTQVTLAWSAPANDGIGTAAVRKYQYQYHRNGSPWVWWRDVPDSDGNKALDDETSFAVTGLTNGVTYNFRVRAVNGAGDGFATAILSTTPTATDTVAPTVSSITRQSTHGGGKTNADSLVWRVTFSEAVVNVDQTDFTVTGTGIGSPDVAVAAVSGSTTTYDVTASSGNLANLNDTVTLGFDSAQNIQDTSGNALTTTLPDGADNTYEVDNTAPTISTDFPSNWGDAARTITITFSEVVTGFAAADVTVTGATASSFTAGTPAGESWTMEIGSATNNGTPVTLEIAANAASDAAGNSNAAFSISADYTRTLEAPATFTATAGDAQVTLNWSAPSDSAGTAALTKYQYRYGSGSPVTWGSWTDVADSDGDNDVTDETSATISSLTNGTAYSFEVRAVNSAGDGAAASATATPAAAATNAVVVSLNRVGGTGAVTEGGTVEFTVTLSRVLTAGEIVEAPLSVSGAGVTTADWSLALKTGTGLNTGVTLSGAATATPKVRFSGAAAQTATLVLTTTPDSTDESGGETVTVALGPDGNVTNGFDHTSLGTNVGGGADPHSTAKSFDVAVNDIIVSIAPKTANTPVTEGSDAVFTVTANPAPTANLPVSLTVADATNADFVSSTNQGSGKSVTIQAGQTTADFTVPTMGGASETTDEPSGDVTVTVASGTGYTVSSSTGSATVKVNDNDATTVTLTTPDTTATEGSSTETASVVLTLGRPLRAGESLGVPLGFSGGAVGTDFTLSLSGSPTGVALSGGTVTFTGSTSGSATVATVLLSASQDVDTTDETVTVSIPSSSTGTPPILTATGLEGGATGSRTGNGQIVLSDDDTATPAKPTGFSATAGNKQVILNWSDPGNSDITAYQIQLKSGNNAYSAWTTIIASSATTTSHTVTGLTNGTAYSFRIRAVAGTVNGAQSDEATATPVAAAPAKPTGFSATAGNGAVSLAWSNPNNSDITGYEYQQKAGGGSYGSWTAISSSSATTTSHTVTGLTNGTAYSFRIRAVAGTVQGTQSDEATATPVAAAPAKPTGFSATAGNGAVSLAWSNPNNSDITGYEYQQKEGGGSYGSWTAISSSSATTTSHTVTGLTNGTAYSFRIRAVAGTVQGTQSDEATATPVAAAPAKPTGFSATAGNGAVSLAWSNPNNSDITGYEYQQKEGGGSYGSWTAISSSSATTTSHTVTGLTNGTAYSFRIRAVAGTVQGTQSDEATATPVAAAPAKPSGFSATAGNGAVSLAWSNPNNSDITGYEYQQKAGGGSYGSWTAISSSSATTTSHTVTGLTNGTAYSFRIRAVAGTVQGTQSDEATATPVAAAPAKPSGFSATAGNGAVSLAWSNPNNSDITGYEYQQKAGGGSYGSWTAISSSSATTTSHTVTGLTNGTAYSFRIRAVAGTVNGAQSDEATATPVAAAPAKPSGFSATAGNGAVSLAWSNPNNSDITGYEYQQKAGGGSYGSWTAISSSSATTTSHTVTGLTNGTAYSFRIRAVAGTVNGAQSDEATATPVAAAPAKPSGFSATAGNGAVSLAWSNPNNSDITGYEYQQKAGGGSYGSWTAISSSSATTTSHTVTGLTNGTAYSFRIRAVAGTVQGTQSDEATATPVAAAPAKPTGFSATAGNGAVSLAWSNPNNSDITGYEYQQKEGGGSYGSWTAISSSSATTTSHTVTGLTNGTAYSFRIRAVAGTVQGTQSDEATATPVAAAPAKPTGFSATAGNGAVSLAWSNPNNSDITGYEYQQKAGGGSYGSWTAISSSSATTTSHTVTGLTNGTAYSFRIRAVAGTVQGTQSDEATATPVAAAPAKPSGFSATAGNGAVSLAWSNPNNSDITGYEYQQKAGGGSYGSWTAISSSSATTTSHTVTGLTNGTAYSFRIRAVAGTVNGAQSDEATATPVAAAPAKPSGFSATAGNGAVSLAWSNPNNSDITGYEYQQKAGGGSYGSWTAISSSSATTTSHTVTGLTNGTAYSFRIRAVAGTVNGAQSDEATATPVAAAPAKPSGFSATAGNGAVSLAWSNPNNSDITGYEYQQKAGGGSYGSWTAISSSSATTTSHTVTGLTNGTAYSFRIRAVAGTVNGAQSDEATATPVAAAPAKPSGFSATAGNGAVSLAWSNPNNSDITGYEYQQKAGGGSYGSWTAISSSSATTTSHTVTGLTNGTAYSFRIRAVAGTVQGTQSDEATATPVAAAITNPPSPLPSPSVPVISISGGDAVIEGDDVAFSLSANPEPPQGVLVSVMVSNNGSVADVGQMGYKTVTIPPSGTATLMVLTIDDDTDEPDGRITARILPGPGYSYEEGSAVATVVVVDDDQPAPVASPPRLTVAAGDSGHYNVALDRQPHQDRTLTISSDAPASDLTIQPHTLLFTPSNWATPQKVTVTPHTNPGAPVTLTHTLTGDAQHVTTTVTVTVTLIAAAPPEAVQQRWLTRFGRTVSQQVVDGIQGRFTAPPPPPGLRLTVAGEDLTTATPLAENQQALSKTLGFQSVTTEQLVQDSNFSFSPSPAEQEGQQERAPHFALWGQGALSSFQGAEQDLSLDGNVTTALLGAEWNTQRWRAGAALSHSTGSGSYEHQSNDDVVGDGDLSTTLTAVFPYARYALTPRLGFWAAAGYGWGSLSLQTHSDDKEYNPGAALTMAALGLDGILLDGGAEDLSLTTTADLLSLTTTSEAVDGLDASEGNVTRFRLGIEAERPFPLSDGASLLPSLEIGVRQDSGDAESGFGVEVAAGLSWNAPDRGISADLHGRTLLAHAEEQFREQGVALSFSWDPDPSNRGPSFSLGRSLGATAEGGMDALLNPTVLQELDDDGNGQQQLEATLAYGFPAYNNRLTLTPRLAVALSSDSATYRLLWSVAPYAQLGQAEPWQLSLEGERQEDNNPDSTANHSLNLRFSLPF